MKLHTVPLLVTGFFGVLALGAYAYANRGTDAAATVVTAPKTTQNVTKGDLFDEIAKEEAALEPLRWTMPEESARRVAREMVATTYLRGGEDRLTVAETMTFDAKGGAGTDWTEYGAGFPLLHWTYDGVPLKERDVLRALAALLARGKGDDAFPSPHEVDLTLCTLAQTRDARLSYADCFRTMRSLEDGGALARSFAVAMRDATACADDIVRTNMAGIEAVAKKLREPLRVNAAGDIDPIGRAEGLDALGWHVGWYRDTLAAHPLSYRPLRDVAAWCSPGKYPMAIDDGMIPQEHCADAVTADAPEQEALLVASDLTVQQALFRIADETKVELYRLDQGAGPDHVTTFHLTTAADMRASETYSPAESVDEEASYYARAFVWDRVPATALRTLELFPFSQSTHEEIVYRSQEFADDLHRLTFGESLARSLRADLRIETFLTAQAVDYDYPAVPEYRRFIEGTMPKIDACIDETLRLNMRAVRELAALIEGLRRQDPDRERALLNGKDLRDFFASRPLAYPAMTTDLSPLCAPQSDR